MDRREFVVGSAALAARAAAAAPERVIETVLGPVPAEQFGLALPHEHILCDFAGADATGRHRWDVDEVVRTMRPWLEQVRERGVRGFVDCTPAYIGRDPRVLRALAQATGLHIVTNTGYYGGGGGRYVPAHAHSESAEQLALRWLAECRDGIEETGIRPGFIKIGIDGASGEPPALSAIDAKLVTAAALASRRSGRSVTCHTGGGAGGLAAARLFVESGGDPARFVLAHSDGYAAEHHQQILALGAWLSFDAAGQRPAAAHAATIAGLASDHANRLLLSADAGWYQVGEPAGGKVRGYEAVTDVLLPALRAAGLADATLRELTVANPATVMSLVAPASAIIT